MKVAENFQNFRQKPSVYAGLRGIDTPKKMQYNSPTVKAETPFSAKV